MPPLSRYLARVVEMYPNLPVIMDHAPPFTRARTQQQCRARVQVDGPRRRRDPRQQAHQVLQHRVVLQQDQADRLDAHHRRALVHRSERHVRQLLRHGSSELVAAVCERRRRQHLCDLRRHRQVLRRRRAQARRAGAQDARQGSRTSLSAFVIPESSILLTISRSLDLSH